MYVLIKYKHTHTHDQTYRSKQICMYVCVFVCNTITCWVIFSLFDFFSSKTFYTSTSFIGDDDDELVGRSVVELDPDGDGKYSFTATTN